LKFPLSFSPTPLVLVSVLGLMSRSVGCFEGALWYLIRQKRVIGTHPNRSIFVFSFGMLSLLDVDVDIAAEAVRERDLSSRLVGYIGARGIRRP
jgi:hypothetical protein